MTDVEKQIVLLALRTYAGMIETGKPNLRAIDAYTKNKPQLVRTLDKREKDTLDIVDKLIGQFIRELN